MNAYKLESPERKLVMWYKVKEKFDMGLTKAQISRELGIDVKTVRKYLRMSYEEFKSSESYKRMYIKLLDPYEDMVYRWLDAHPDLSASQIHDWLREHNDTLPTVNGKTVYNFVKYVRAKYNVDKPKVGSERQYERLEETPYGEYAQVDFGEMWMERTDKRKIKVYFFVMVLSRSRKKYVWFNLSPFTSDMTVYAHEKAFEYYGGKPKKIIYDQDAVLIHSENMGDYILTKAFNSYVNQAHFEAIFCKKADPESKGKVENAVKYVKYNFLRGREFVSIEQLNEEAVRWLSRTANGLPHNGTKQIPDKVYEEERAYMTPYYGKPEIPNRAISEYKVHKNNTISYHGNVYSLPSGTYQGPQSKVWVNVKENILEVYSSETGKQIAVHILSKGRGEYILDPSHRVLHKISANKKEAAILEYCNHDELAEIWLRELKEDKPRYYKDNVRLFFSEMRHFEPGTLHRVFEICLDRGMYNAKEFMSLCDRTGRRKPIREQVASLPDNVSEIAGEMPEKTDINTYNQYFL